MKRWAVPHAFCSFSCFLSLIFTKASWQILKEKSHLQEHFTKHQSNSTGKRWMVTHDFKKGNWTMFVGKCAEVRECTVISWTVFVTRQQTTVSTTYVPFTWNWSLTRGIIILQASRPNIRVLRPPLQNLISNPEYHIFKTLIQSRLHYLSEWPCSTHSPFKLPQWPVFTVVCAHSVTKISSRVIRITSQGPIQEMNNLIEENFSGCWSA